jgi:hypothetical protein
VDEGVPDGYFTRLIAVPPARSRSR